MAIWPTYDGGVAGGGGAVTVTVCCAESYSPEVLVTVTFTT